MHNFYRVLASFRPGKEADILNGGAWVVRPSQFNLVEHKQPQQQDLRMKYPVGLDVSGALARQSSYTQFQLLSDFMKI